MPPMHGSLLYHERQVSVHIGALDSYSCRHMLSCHNSEADLAVYSRWMHHSELGIWPLSRQDAALCGVHTLNTLLQGPYFTAVELSQV